MRSAATFLVLTAALTAAACTRPAPRDASAPDPDTDPYLALNTLLVRHGCSNCHGVDYQRVGPALKDVAALYAQATPDQLAALRGSILNGAKGKYGTAQMPPQHQVTAQQADRLIAAIRALPAR